MTVSIDWSVGSVVDRSGSSSHPGGEDGGVGHGVVAELGGGCGQESGEAEGGL